MPTRYWRRPREASQPRHGAGVFRPGAIPPRIATAWLVPTARRSPCEAPRRPNIPRRGALTSRPEEDMRHPGTAPDRTNPHRPRPPPVRAPAKNAHRPGYRTHKTLPEPRIPVKKTLRGRLHPREERLMYALYEMNREHSTASTGVRDSFLTTKLPPAGHPPPFLLLPLSSLPDPAGGFLFQRAPRPDTEPRRTQSTSTASRQPICPRQVTLLPSSSFLSPLFPILPGALLFRRVAPACPADRPPREASAIRRLARPDLTLCCAQRHGKRGTEQRCHDSPIACSSGAPPRRLQEGPGRVCR